MCNKYVIKVTEAAISGSTLTLTSSSTLSTLCDRKEYVLLICTNIPASTTVAQAVLAIGGSTYPLQDFVGNNLMSDQIKCRRCYPMVFGTNPAHFKLCTCTCRSGAEATTATVTPATAASLSADVATASAKGVSK